MTKVGTGICKSCGRPKPGGQGRKLCDPCRSTAAETRRSRRAVYAQTYHAANRERRQAQHRAWVRENPEQDRALKRRAYEKQKGTDALLGRRLARFGVSVDEYKALLAAQGGVCAIC